MKLESTIIRKNDVSTYIKVTISYKTKIIITVYNTCKKSYISGPIVNFSTAMLYRTRLKFPDTGSDSIVMPGMPELSGMAVNSSYSI